MIRLTVLFLFAAAASLFSQDFRYGWISDLHIGAPGADGALENIVNGINKHDNIRFVVITGDISQNGHSSEFEKAKNLLDKLSVKYYLIPGEHDIKFSETGGSKIKDLWGDDKFTFEYEGMKFIGLSNACDWHGISGHFSVEGLNWLDSLLAGTKPDQELVLLTHFPFTSETDNWYKVTNRLRNSGIRMIQTGSGHKNQIMSFSGIPAAMCREAMGDAKTPAGFTIVENRPDSLLFFDGNADSAAAPWGAVFKGTKPEIPQIDSSDFIDYYSAVTSKAALNTTLNIPPVIWKNRIYTASPEGHITCIDSTGAKLWEFPAGTPVVSGPVIADSLLVFAAATGDLFTLKAATGKVIQTVGIGEPITSKLISINYKGDKFLIDGSKPDTAIVMGTSSGKLMCYDINSLDQLWENNSAKDMIISKPLYVENKIVFGSQDGFLYCVDARSGVMIWKWSSTKNPAASQIECTPVTDGKYVYVVSSDKSVASIDLLLGKLHWKKDNLPAAGAELSSDKTRLLIKGSNDKFYYISSGNGKVIKEVNLKSGPDSSPVTPLEYNGGVFTACRKGIVQYIDKDYNVRPLIYTGSSRLHSVMHLTPGKFAAADLDGLVTIFELK